MEKLLLQYFQNQGEEVTMQNILYPDEELEEATTLKEPPSNATGTYSGVCEKNKNKQTFIYFFTFFVLVS